MTRRPHAIATWSRVFAVHGWTPSKQPPSIEALVKHAVRVGAHDLAQLGGAPLEVRAARAGDTFLPIGGVASEAPDIGEIVYTNRHIVRTRHWVRRQAGNARITPDASAVLYPINGFAKATGMAVGSAMRDLAAACRDLLRADVTTGLLSAHEPRFTSEMPACAG